MALMNGGCQAVLTREFRVRVLDVSAGGCLVQSDRPVGIGVLGRLRLRLGSDEFVEDVEIVRCQVPENAGPVFHVGLRFLWTKPRHARSIRHAVDGGIADLFAVPETTRVM
jgi:hypothetical protein